MCSRSTQIIPGLLRRANKFAAQVEVLEADVERLETDLKALAAAKCKLEEYETKRRNRER
jgi:outer membrane murein-binding lipoprotein Lpp